MHDSLTLILALAPIGLAIVLPVLSLIPALKFSKPSIFLNYFSIYVILELVNVVGSRIFLRPISGTISDFLFMALPIAVIALWILRKRMFVWMYVGYSIGMMLSYLINAFEPQMSKSVNFSVAGFHLLVLSSYICFLRIKYREDLRLSLSEFRFWLNDYDKKEALNALMPFIAIGAVYIIIIVIIVIKFHRVFLAKLSF